MDKISIILPVYNAELFLTECLKSIRNQDFKNFEVIMINDCSTDGSSKILEYFASNDERFKLYNNNNNNNGLSKTRNRGISEASGDFIFFVDADDIIDKYCLSKLYKLLVDNDADISISGFQIFEHDIRTSEFDEETNVFDNNSIMKELAICDQIQNFAWGKLYKKDLFNDVQFPIGRVYEDVNTIPLVFSKTQKTVFTNDKLYFYRQNKNSISKTLNLQKVRDFFFSMEEKGRLYLDKYPQFLKYMSQSYFDLFYLIKEFKINKKSIENYKNTKKIYKLAISKAPLKQKLKYLLAVS